MTTPRTQSIDNQTQQNNNQQISFENAKIIEERSSKNNEVRQYAKGKFLGKGGFAKCYEFTQMDTKNLYAAKVIPKSTLNKSRAKQKLMSEIKIHRSLNYSKVVKFEHFFEDFENVYILLELASNQTMNELLRRRKRLTELEVQCYLVQIINCLQYLHNNRVIHRDLKLGNLFLSEKMEIKLGDFGLATKLDYDGEKKKTICGTPNYIAPEILEGKTGHSYEVDIWSLGVIMYTLLIGKPPFETNDVKTTYKRIKMNAYSFPESVTISSQGRDLITKILVTDPIKRPTLSEILSHDFFHQGNSIPSLLPVSTLACPPSSSYLRQFQQSSKEKSVGKVSPTRLENTAPVTKQFLKERKDFINTDRINMMQVDVAQNFDMNNINNLPIKTDINNFELNLQTEKDILKQKIKNNNELSNQLKYSQSSASQMNNFQTKLTTEIKINSFNKASDQLATQEYEIPINKNQDVWVKKWVDYSCKYGLGYILNNGAAGAFFNDSSKIILDMNEDIFHYIERKGNDREDIITKHSCNDYPKDMQKKITLLRHFKSYLETDKKDNNKPESQLPAGEGKQEGIYVKKWLRTKHAILFRLSNKVVQVIFQDQTEIILSSELKLVTYVNKKFERQVYPLANALESSNQEMAKRLKYTKDILTHMLGSGQNDKQRTNKHQQIEKNISSSQQNSLNKFTPFSVDSKFNSQNYQTNPNFNNLANINKIVQNTISGMDGIDQKKEQSSQRLAQKSYTNSMSGSCFNANKKDIFTNSSTQNTQPIENLQMSKCQSQIVRNSLGNQNVIKQTNNFMQSQNQNQNQKKIENQSQTNFSKKI